MTSLIQSMISYLESAHYLVIALILILIYIILREGLKRAAEHHGYIAVSITALVFALLLYLNLYLYALLDFLALVLMAYFSIRADEIKAAREEKQNLRIEQARNKVRTRASNKASRSNKKVKN